MVFGKTDRSISLVDRSHCFRQSARYSRSFEVIDSLPAEIVFIAGEHLIGLVYGPDLKLCKWQVRYHEGSTDLSVISDELRRFILDLFAFEKHLDWIRVNDDSS